MTADLGLRQAADRLDALADAATPGPWVVHAVGSRADVRGLPENTSYDYRGDSVATAADSDFGAMKVVDAAYIAAMHPGVAKALAAWLRAAYDDERRFAAIGAVGFPGENPGFAVARAILADPP